MVDGVPERGLYNIHVETGRGTSRCAMVRSCRYYSRLCYHFPGFLAICIENMDSDVCLHFDRCRFLARSNGGITPGGELEDER